MEEQVGQALVLKPKEAKYVGLILFCLALGAAGVSMARSGKAAGWFVAGLFGVGGLVLTIQLLPGASYLALKPEGFVMCSFFRPWAFSWTDVDSFSVGSMGRNKVVTFRFSESYQKQTGARKLARAISGAEAALPDTYGMDAEELARLLNEWRNRAGR